MYDTLAHKLAFRHHLKPKKDLTCTVSTCGNDMKTMSGFWNGNMDSPEEMRASHVFRRHTGIDRTTGTVAPSIFFMTQTMSDLKKDPVTETFVQQHLAGSLYVNNEQLAALKTICEGTLFVGSSRTRGNGEIQLTVGDEENPAHFPDIMNWDTDFKTKLKSCVDQEIPSHFLEGIYFGVKLESEFIVVDRFLRPSFDLTFPLESIQPILKITNSTVIRGWQSAWGLPKPDDIGLTMGSVFLFRYLGNDMDALNQLLNENVVNGIGLRREEGYGRISLCDPLHIQKEAV
jgi:CRISPR-associated Csx10 family RAMP protein